MFIKAIKRLAQAVPIWIVALLISACGTIAPAPVPTVYPVQPTILPQATVGSLASITVDQVGVTLLAPTTWKPPAVTSDKRLVLSPDGSTDISVTSGPFLYVIADAGSVLAKSLSYTFRPDITDPALQLDLLLQALNIDAYSFGRGQKYEGAQYPAAMVTGFARDNQLTLMLMKAGDNRWIFVGAQSPERLYSYYDSVVFTPAINSIKVK
ncbi:MAG: hypothetical protein ABI947_13980 [Chloroflexota bacterium]